MKTEIPKTEIPARKRAKASAPQVANPYLDSELYARMRDYTEREAAVAKELRAIAERGAGRRSPDPHLAPSLQAICGMVKKGLPLADMLDRIVAGIEKGLWAGWLAEYGFELRDVNYAQTGPRNARLALDLRAGSKANAVFAKAGIPNWRSRAAEDCAQLQIEKAQENADFKAFAIFHLDPAAQSSGKGTGR